MIIFSVLFLIVRSQKIYNYENITDLGIQLLAHPIFEDNLKNRFRDHDITIDTEFMENNGYYKDLMDIYHNDLLESLKQIDQYLYIKNVDEENKEFGLFASVDIEEDTVLGYISGIITDSPNYKDQELLYPVYFEKMNYLHFDKSKNTNLQGFIRSNEEGNCQLVLYPYNNKWVYLIIAQQDIKAGDEFLYLPGDNYLYNKDLSKRKKYVQYKPLEIKDAFDGIKFQDSDLETLGMNYTRENSVDSRYQLILENRKIEKTWRYKHYNDSYIDNEEYFESFLERDSTNDMVYAKFQNQDFGYTCYAKTFIEKDTVIGEYTGQIQIYKEQEKYYKKHPYKTQNVSFIIDASIQGNILKFIQDQGDKTHNLEAVVIPIKNEWRIFYRTIKDIQQDEIFSIKASELLDFMEFRVQDPEEINEAETKDTQLEENQSQENQDDKQLAVEILDDEDENDDEYYKKQNIIRQINDDGSETLSVKLSDNDDDHSDLEWKSLVDFDSDDQEQDNSENHNQEQDNSENLKQEL